MTDLDTILRDALTTDAERAPHLPDEWVGPTTATIVPVEARRRTRPVLLAVGGMAAAAVAIGGLAIVARPDDPTVPAATTPPWTPAGIEFEFPLVDLGPATKVPDGPVVDALARSIEVDGHLAQVVTTSITYQGGETAIVQSCTWEGGSGGCIPEWNPATWQISISSSVDNGDAEYDLWMVEGLPVTAAFVSYADGDVVRWQRPVAGFAAFPNVEGPDELVIAYDAGGVEIGRYNLAEYNAVASSAVPPLTADISQEQFEALNELTRSAMGACLTNAGGTLGSGGVATFPEGLDQIAVWSQCVVEVKAIVAQAVAELEPRFYDPRTERPENPATPFSYGD